MGSSISSCISGKEIEREDRKWNLKSLSASFNILSSLGRLPGCWDSTAASTVANTYDLQTFKRGTFQKSHLFLPWPEVSVTLLGPPFFIDNTSLENIARPGSLLTYSNIFWCYCIFLYREPFHFWQLHYYSTLILVQENRLARISALMAIFCWRKKSWLFSYSTFKSNSVPPTASRVFPKFSPFLNHPPPPRWQDKRH